MARRPVVDLEKLAAAHKQLQAALDALAETKRPRTPETVAPNRWDCPGIVCIGDRVIWDGEAEYLGLKPLTHWPPRTTAEVES
jgi:hypothetical protein